ncbi:MAG: hypothetical protein GC145_06880 [Caulobacter sp.]|nr:hypothetical protein [Caulobacter sp.]
MSMMMAAKDGPPPYPQALTCAGLSRVWSEQQSDAGAPTAADARSDAEFWAFAAMDAARQSGHTADAAEADQLKSRDAARTLFADQPQDAAKGLETCRQLKPPGV